MFTTAEEFLESRGAQDVLRAPAAASPLPLQRTEPTPGRIVVTWERLLQQVQAAADAAGEIDWDISVDSTIVRAHQHAAGARTGLPPVPAVPKRDETLEHQDET